MRSSLFSFFFLFSATLGACAIDAEGSLSDAELAGGAAGQIGVGGQAGSGGSILLPDEVGGANAGIAGSGGSGASGAGQAGTAGSGGSGQAAAGGTDSAGSGGGAGVAGSAGDAGAAGTAGTAGAGPGGAGSPAGGAGGEGAGAAGAPAGNAGTGGDAGASGAGQAGSGGAGEGGAGAGAGGAGNGGAGAGAGGTGGAGAGGAAGATECGNNKKEEGEDCDGTDLAGQTCASLKPDAVGQLGCSNGCSYDTTGCTLCGNNKVDSNEECDASSNEPVLCSDGQSGTATCTDSCKRDTSQCKDPTCTDVAKNGTETDVDCGGSCAAACLPTKGCNTSNDCATATCTNATCQNPKNCVQQSECSGGQNCVADYCINNGQDWHQVPSAGPECPNGWTKIGSYGCFRRENAAKSWFDAFQQCRIWGGNLARLDTVNELNDVGFDPAGGGLPKSQVSTTQLWVGLACVNDNNCSDKGSWKWLGGVNVLDEWGMVQGIAPPAFDAPCGYIRRRGDGMVGYGATQCTQTRAFLCERPL